MGSLITVKADGAVIMQANDATFGAGRVGIGAVNDAAWWDDIAIVDPASADTSPPSTPANIVASALSSSEVAVSWSVSTDDVGVTGYRVYRDGTLAASATGTSTSVTGLSGGVRYAFSVAAVDAAGNASSQSAPGARDNAGVCTACAAHDLVLRRSGHLSQPANRSP